MSQVGFIDQHEQFLGLVGLEEGRLAIGEFPGGIEEANAEIRLGQGPVGAADAFLFDFTRRIPQSSGIDQMKRITMKNDRFFNGITGGSGMGGDNGAVAASQIIQEGGFADIGSTGDDDAGAFAEDTAFLPGRQKSLDFAGNAL